MLKNQHILWLGRALSVLLILFCGTANSAESDETPVFVDPEWLLENINRDDVLVIDASKEEIYARGHIEGAASLPSLRTYSQTEPKDRVGPESHITRLFSRLGVDENTHVIVYDSGEFKFAARIMWTLHLFGHEKVSILNIDYPGWAANGYPTSTEIPARSAKKFKPNLAPEYIATSFHTLLATKNSNATIVDVRDAAEYRGETSRSRRYGHIPTAQHLDWRKMATVDKSSTRIISREKLADLFKHIDKDKKIITYCQKGHEASLAYVAFRLLGYNVSVYDGSWHEWGNSSNLPVSGSDSVPTPPKAAS